MPEFLNRVGRGLAKVLDIDLETEDRVTRGESIASGYSADTYIEPEPSSVEWLRNLVPSRQDTKQYFTDLLPFLSWIHRYNLTWFIADLVAGITVGAVVVPQGMAYAKLAQLPVQFGLYSSFVGVLIYWPFATSKDITIGPVAVMSQLVGNIVLDAQKSHPNLQGHVVASALAVITGSIVFFLGIVRLGFIVDFIPLPAIAAFMTGSALNIAVGQLPTVFGTNKLLNTRDSTYLVFIHFLQKLPEASIDTAMGLTALFLLYFIRWSTTRMAKRSPKQERLWFFLSTLRTVFVILLYTMISWLVNMSRRSNPRFSILGTVPRGFQNMGVPQIDGEIIGSFASQIPVACIVLLIEHIAISKSFGRVYGYSINPSQELVAIGISNIFGPFFGGYPATGSFSRTAIKAKAGVRTPLAGVITALVVLLAIYALPAVFFYIPNAPLSAVIIHAVGDLITPPKTVYKFWRVNPIEVVIFFAGVIVTVFTTIEIGIYTTIIASAVVLLWRIAKAYGDFLGKVKVRSVDGLDDTRNLFIPLDHADGSNPLARVESPYPGVFIYRFGDSYLYPNAFHYTSGISNHLLSATKRTNTQSYPKLGDRPWNLPGPRHIDPSAAEEDPRPTLRAIILDFSSVIHVDITSVQNLVDMRDQLDKHAAPDQVQWHFASIRSPWTKRALAAAGFGRAKEDSKSVFSVAEVGGGLRQNGQKAIERRRDAKADEEIAIDDASSGEGKEAWSREVPVLSVDRPLFHADLDEAVRSTLANLGIKDFSGPLEKSD